MVTEQPGLSDTELAILRQVATGATNREIARTRGISEATVKKHLTNINSKLGTGNRTEATRRALELGIVTVDTPGSGADGMDREAARRLAEELERSRRRSRRLTRSVVAVGAVAVLSLAVIGYFVARPDALDGGAQGAALVAPVAATPGWEPGVNLPTPRTGLALVADDVDGSVYAISGRDAGGLVADTLRYRVRGYRWEHLADKPTPVENAGAAQVWGEFVVPGGCDAEGKALRVVEVYDPDTDRWRTGAPLPEPRCAYGLAALGGELYLFGGRTSDDPVTASDKVWRYDPRLGEWSLESEMPLPRSDLAAVVVGSGIRVLGGRDERGRPQTNHWIYRPHPTKRWESNEKVLPEGRAGHAAVATSVRNIHVVGGGWDHRLETGAILLRLADRDASWEPDVQLPGFTPFRGAPMVLADGRLLVLVGGQVEDRLLDRHYRREVIRSQLIIPR
jgi:DNA-binding CsgD family transcriptional regulator